MKLLVEMAEFDWKHNSYIFIKTPFRKKDSSIRNSRFYRHMKMAVEMQHAREWKGGWKITEMGREIAYHYRHIISVLDGLNGKQLKDVAERRHSKRTRQSA